MTKACRPRVARHKTGSAAATAVWAVVVSTVLCANLVAPIAAADTSPPPGSYLCNPPSRSNQCSGTPVVATVGPCDVPAADRATAVLPVTRGEDLHLQWPRNSHAGGVVRLAWARTGASDSASAFDAGVQEFRCFEWPCDSQNGCRGDVDGDCTACGGPARVPFELADGEWTLQWMWYGGGFGLPTSYSCVDVLVNGGTSVAVTDPPALVPSFTPGDATYSDTCWACPTCADGSSGLPSEPSLLSLLTEFSGATALGVPAPSACSVSISEVPVDVQGQWFQLSLSTAPVADALQAWQASFTLVGATVTTCWGMGGHVFQDGDVVRFSGSSPLAMGAVVNLDCGVMASAADPAVTAFTLNDVACSVDGGGSGGGTTTGGDGTTTGGDGTTTGGDGTTTGGDGTTTGGDGTTTGGDGTTTGGDGTTGGGSEIGHACPTDSFTGIACYPAVCGRHMFHCSDGYAHPLQAMGAGTRCSNGVIVHEATCATADEPCANGSHDAGEADVDCGGSCSTPCADGSTCSAASDCASGVCGSGGVCAAPICSDGVHNGDETDVDCGGAGCASKCADGLACSVASDCTSGVCGSGGVCAVPTCSDGVRNGDETDVDCGGASCGSTCSVGATCASGDDCTTAVCDGVSSTCSSPVCGDSVCATAGGETCASCSADCGDCATPTCSDGVHNGDETDVDCGGSCAETCADGSTCSVASDCASGVCGSGGVCAAPTCSDGVHNGDETDVDCGGARCGSTCSVGATCASGDDCTTAVCTGNSVCGAAACGDGVCSDASETCASCAADCGACDDDDGGGGDPVPTCTEPHGVFCFPSSCCSSYIQCSHGFVYGPFPTPPGTLCAEGQFVWPTDDACAGVTCGGGPSCSDGLHNGDETDVDCGGAVCGTACDTGLACGSSSDCTSRVCAGGVCVAPSCSDGVRNGGEAGVDCGAVCVAVAGSACSAGTGCTTHADCASGVCHGGVCVSPTCYDGVRNGVEADVDCGGPECASTCSAGRTCSVGSDCASGVCDGTSLLCQPPTCTDGVRNGGESGVDCGGGAGAGCVALCGVGGGCTNDGDCASGTCDSSTATCAAQTCGDGLHNGDETDVDCGGPSCGTACDAGLACGSSSDCTSRVCDGGVCVPPSCSDGVRNGGEAGVDCGAVCGDSLCTHGSACGSGGDCASGVCSGGSCAVHTCGDAVHNGDETDVDCGGSCGGKCASGRGCASGGDCTSGVCDGGAGVCAAPSCGDAVCNGGETCVTCATDCGSCPPTCGDGTCDGGVETCDSCPSDCVDGCDSSGGGGGGGGGGGTADGRMCPSDGIQCWPGNCCAQFYQCAAGYAYPLQATGAGTVCHSGDIVAATDDVCAGVVCGDGDGGSTPRPSVCGDTLCDASESCSSCAQDCGSCPPLCGNGVCDGAETCASCAGDCGTCGGDSGGGGDGSDGGDGGDGSDGGDGDGGDSSSGVGTPKLIGYHTNWAQYRSPAGGMYKFFPEDIDATKFTHIIYAFAKVKDVTYETEPFEWNDVLDYTNGMYKRFHDHVRAQNPHVKTLIAVGGWNFNFFDATKHIFSDMAASPEGRASFIAHAIAYCRTHGFDGYDIDWEYPGVYAQGGNWQDKANFATLVREFRQAIDAEVLEPGQSRLLLTIAVSAAGWVMGSGYDVPNIHPYVDWIGIMSYDLHGSWEYATAPHSGLYACHGCVAGLDVASAMDLWIDAGAPPSKVVMGAATYGRSWTLNQPHDPSKPVSPTSAANGGMGAAASKAGTAGVVTREAGFLSYYEILEMRAQPDTTTVYDPTSRTYFSVNGNQWVGYDTPETMNDKVDHALSLGLGGMMVWALDLDDFIHGNPLISALSQRLFVSAASTIVVSLTNATTSGRRLSSGGGGGSMSVADVNTLRAALAASVRVPVEAFRFVRPPGTEHVNGGAIDVEIAIVPTHAVPAEEVTARVLDAAARHQLLAGPTFSVSAVKVAPNQATADDDTVGGDDGAGQNANGGTPNGYGQGGGAFGSLAVVALALVAAAVVIAIAAFFAVRMHNGSRSFRGGNNKSSAGGGFASVDPIHPHTGNGHVDGSVATTSKSSSLVLDPKHVRSHTEDLERMVAGLGDEGSAAAAIAPLPPSLASAQSTPGSGHANPMNLPSTGPRRDFVMTFDPASHGTPPAQGAAAAAAATAPQELLTVTSFADDANLSRYAGFPSGRRMLVPLRHAPRPDSLKKLPAKPSTLSFKLPGTLKSAASMRGLAQLETGGGAAPSAGADQPPTSAPPQPTHSESDLVAVAVARASAQPPKSPPSSGVRYGHQDSSPESVSSWHEDDHLNTAAAPTPQAGSDQAVTEHREDAGGDAPAMATSTSSSAGAAGLVRRGSSLQRLVQRLPMARPSADRRYAQQLVDSDTEE